MQFGKPVHTHIAPCCGEFIECSDFMTDIAMRLNGNTKCGTAALIVQRHVCKTVVATTVTALPPDSLSNRRNKRISGALY